MSIVVGLSRLSKYDRSSSENPKICVESAVTEKSASAATTTANR